jgi:DNA-binding MarR family transcriptional regulator
MEEICEDLGYKRAQVSIAVRDLVEMKIILKVPNGDDKRRSKFMLNPHQSWKGKAIDRAKKIAEYNPQQLALTF